MQWVANPVNDMYADAIVAAVLQADLLDTPIKSSTINAKIDRMHFKVAIIVVEKSPYNFELLFLFV